MKEEFLHYIWKHQYFDRNGLLSSQGAAVEVIDPGEYNEGSGPDFRNSRCSINGILWTGFVEIHVRGSDWYRHGHQEDPNYDLVILHVVFENDRPVILNGRLLPTIELSRRIPDTARVRYFGFNPLSSILCSHYLPSIDSKVVGRLLNSQAERRLERKADAILVELAAVDHDWDELAYRNLGRCFGFKLNQKALDSVVRHVNFRTLRVHTHFQVEAILFGVSGFLNQRSVDDYHEHLKQEFCYLEAKFKLKRIEHPIMWNTRSIRHTSFPSLRIAQFAAILAQTRSIFQSLNNIGSTQEASGLFGEPVSTYWEQHYFFGKKLKRRTSLGHDSISSLIINAVVPLQMAWHRFSGRDPEALYRLLLQTAPENNRVVRRWRQAGIMASNAFETQALLELFNQDCSNKRCLSCNIGKEVIG